MFVSSSTTARLAAAAGPLEREVSFSDGHRAARGPGGDRRLVVLVRAGAGRVEKVRTFSTDCALDAGGRSVLWLTGIDEAQSVRILAPLAAHEMRKVSDGAMHALSAHEGRPSVDALISLAKRDPMAHAGQASSAGPESGRGSSRRHHRAIGTTGNRRQKKRSSRHQPRRRGRSCSSHGAPDKNRRSAVGHVWLVTVMHARCAFFERPPPASAAPVAGTPILLPPLESHSSLEGASI